jgi:hypothetical protein
MKRKTVKRLTLTKETMRRMTNTELSGVAGGMTGAGCPGSFFFSICDCNTDSLYADCPDPGIETKTCQPTSF